MRVKEEVMFEVGDGATVYHYSDSHAYTVIEVSKSGTKAVIQRDKATRTNADKDKIYPGGFAAHFEYPDGQKYAYERNEDGKKLNIYRDKNGRWRVSKARYLRVGAGRHEWYDANF